MQGNLVLNDGEVLIGSNPTHRLTNGGNFTMGAAAELTFHRGDADQSRLDTNVAAVDGTVRINYATFTPAVSAPRTAIEAAPLTISLSFIDDNLSAPWASVVSDTVTTLSIAVSESELPSEPTNFVTSHDEPENDDTIDVTWDDSDDFAGSGVDGYSWEFTTGAADNADSSVDSATAEATSGSLADGTWYLHVRAIDNIPNESATVHSAAMVVDTTDPGLPGAVITDHDGGALTTPVVEANWAAAADATSGVDGYSWAFSQGATDDPDGTIEGAGLSATSNSLAVGAWYFHVVAIDEAGNVGATAHVGPFTVAVAAGGGDVCDGVSAGGHCFTSGNDSVTGDSSGEEMHGLAGNDTLRGRGGSDKLFGDGGNDKLFGDSGNDLLSGGRGADRLFGGAGRNVLLGGPGKDRLVIGGRGGIARGGSGSDNITGTGRRDLVWGGSGNDRINTGEGNDYINVGPGRDRVRAGAGHDVIHASHGGKTTVDCGTGTDTAYVDPADRWNTTNCEFVVVS